MERFYYRQVPTASTAQLVIDDPIHLEGEKGLS